MAKLGDKILSGMASPAFPAILLSERTTNADDEFVEVHVFGPVTCRTFAEVTVTRKVGRPNKVLVKALAAKLAKVGLVLKVVDA